MSNDALATTATSFATPVTSRMPEWDCIRPLIPRARSAVGTASPYAPVDMREVMNGIMYILSTGTASGAICRKTCPARSTVNDYFVPGIATAHCNGCITRSLCQLCREQAERDASPTAAIIDSQSVKSAEKGGPISIRPGLMAASAFAARSAILLVDMLGLLLDEVITPAQRAGPRWR